MDFDPQGSTPAPVIATFEAMRVGARLKYGDGQLIVSSKDGLRIELYLSGASQERTVSYYAPEFDAKEFEIIPIPVKVGRK